MSEHDWVHNGDTCFCRKCGELENGKPCAVQTDEEKKDAQIAALTERLRIVEAERDEARNGVKKSAEAYGALMERAEKLRTELERKDAALRRLESASVAVDKAWHYEARQGDGIMEEHEPQELELQMALIDARAALQPKEPPCQTT